MATGLRSRCPAPVAPLLPLGGAQTLTFSMPIDTADADRAFRPPTDTSARPTLTSIPDPFRLALSFRRPPAQKGPSTRYLWVTVRTGTVFPFQLPQKEEP